MPGGHSWHALPASNLRSNGDGVTRKIANLLVRNVDAILNYSNSPRRSYVACSTPMDDFDRDGVRC